MSQISESIIDVAQSYGIQFKRMGGELYGKCPFHADGKRPNLRVNIDKNSWFCDVCNEGGGVVEFIAKKEGREKKQVFRELAKKNETTAPQGEIVSTYDYIDQLGNLRYQVCRLVPKTFRQRRPDGKGGWVWNMEGVERILYRLPDILKPQNRYVWIVEGEKDVETIRKLGMAATCNVGGAGKWSEAYSQALKGKDILLCGDNDEPGKKHIAAVMESLEPYAASIRKIELPPQFKDISDYAASFNDSQKLQGELMGLIDAAPVMLRGGMLPVKSMAELEVAYVDHLKASKNSAVDLSRWLRGLGCVRPLVPGELVAVVGDTGAAKTYVLQHIAWKCGVPTLLFELELPDALTFERFLSIAHNRGGESVQREYDGGGRLDRGALDHIYVCPKSKLTPDEIESIILKSELKMGVRPALVLVDYIQLIKGIGKRYERTSDAAEQLKVIAKNTGTVIVMASQVGREKESPEITLHDAKDSGSIENSSGLVLGIWRDSDNAQLLYVRVLKNTKGRPSEPIKCVLKDGMRIEQAPIIDDEDVPQ